MREYLLKKILYGVWRQESAQTNQRPSCTLVAQITSFVRMEITQTILPQAEMGIDGLRWAVSAFWRINC